MRKLLLVIAMTLVASATICGALRSDEFSSEVSENQYPESRFKAQFQSESSDVETDTTWALSQLSPSDEALLRKMNPAPKKHDSRSFIYPNLRMCIKDRRLRPFVVRALKEDVDSYWEAKRRDLRGEPQSTFEAHCEVAWNSPAILSLILSTESYFGGAATSSTSVAGLNLWKKSPGKIAVEQVFQPGFARDLAVFVAAEMSRHSEDDTLILPVFDMDNTDFENFSLSPGGMDFIIPGNASAERRVVKVPYATILPILRTSFVKSAELPFNEQDVNAARKDLEHTLITSAIGTLSKIVAQSPDNADAYALRARWYRKLGRDEPAKIDEEHARKLQVQSSEEKQ